MQLALFLNLYKTLVTFTSETVSDWNTLALTATISEMLLTFLVNGTEVEYIKTK